MRYPISNLSQKWIFGTRRAQHVSQKCWSHHGRTARDYPITAVIEDASIGCTLATRVAAAQGGVLHRRRPKRRGVSVSSMLDVRPGSTKLFSRRNILDQPHPDVESSGSRFRTRSPRATFRRGRPAACRGSHEESRAAPLPAPSRWLPAARRHRWHLSNCAARKPEHTGPAAAEAGCTGHLASTPNGGRLRRPLISHVERLLSDQLATIVDW